MPTTPKTPPIRFKFDHSGVQALIRWIMDIQGLSQYEISRRAGLNPATIYNILRRNATETTRKPHRSTITRIAGATGYDVTFESGSDMILLKRAPKRARNREDIEALLDELRTVLVLSGKRLPKAEREKVKEIVRILIE
jgi:transcriptional regulator with XRE-family HTH domain